MQTREIQENKQPAFPPVLQSANRVRYKYAPVVPEKRFPIPFDGNAELRFK